MDNNPDRQQLLRDPDIDPSSEVLILALGESYGAYVAFSRKLPAFNIELTWQYYHDGKSWLAKGTHKKKTVFWLSVWEGLFRVTLFFTEKTRADAQALPISDRLKTSLAKEKARGKLVPLIVDIPSAAALDDVYHLIAYKQSLK